MSLEVPEPGASLSGLTPLSSGPYPLTRPASWAWAALILLGTLFFGYGLTAIAATVAEVTVPPDALVFGSASVNPASGWTVAERTPFAVTLDNQGVAVTFTSSPAAGQSAAVRTLDLAAQMRKDVPQLTVSSDPAPFTTDQGDVGQLIALASTSQTAIVASVVDAGQAVDVSSIGPSTQFGESIADIESMLKSIRIVAPAATGATAAGVGTRARSDSPGVARHG